MLKGVGGGDTVDIVGSLHTQPDAGSSNQQLHEGTEEKQVRSRVMPALALNVDGGCKKNKT